jgi:hypothetical protein
MISTPHAQSLQDNVDASTSTEGLACQEQPCQPPRSSLRVRTTHLLLLVCSTLVYANTDVVKPEIIFRASEGFGENIGNQIGNGFWMLTAYVAISSWQVMCYLSLHHLFVIETDAYSSF